MDEKNKYTTGNITKILGTTRDTLRHYESKGLLSPLQNAENNYREYDFFDIYALMFIDFYKKRGLTLDEIKNIKVSEETSNIRDLLNEKETEIEHSIFLQKQLLENIRETFTFCDTLDCHLNKHSIRRMPLYEVTSQFPDITSVEEYPAILNSLNTHSEDILSNIVREIITEGHNILETRMLAVKKANQDILDSSKTYLDFEKCIYSVVEDSRENGTMEKTFASMQNFAKANQLSLLGNAYVLTRLITYQEKEELAFLEVYVPIE